MRLFCDKKNTYETNSGNFRKTGNIMLADIAKPESKKACILKEK